MRDATAPTDAEPARLLRLAEMILVFFVLPPCLYFARHQLSFRVVPLVFVLSVVALLLMLKTGMIESRALWHTDGLGHHLRKVLVTFLLLAPLAAAASAVLLPLRFFAFPAARPGLWMLVMVLYPVLAAYPQEILFRGFFFSRYRRLFSHPTAMIAVNAVSFGLAHLLYANPVAPVLSGLGGALFGYRYYKSGSLLVASIEHALWGDFLFTVGLGWFFYSGAIR